MKIVVGLSGGVDSSVAAYLLQQEGHEVIALFMRNWNDASVTLEDECPWIEDSNDALFVAQKLGIPFQVIDMSEDYKNRIVDYMFEEYAAGRTPNPDVLCNREIKFDLFMKTAIALGADKVATGHYAQVTEQTNEKGNRVFSLLAGKDNNKDQSYFLCQLNQEQLSKALFPIGHLEKPKVREIAKELGLVTADKKDSQGLCFIGKVSLPEFLQQQLEKKEGNIVEIFAENPIYQKPNTESSFLEQLKVQSHNIIYHEKDGKIIGKHLGAHFYTNGQSKGLGIGGHKESCYVLSRDVATNIVYVGEGKNHPGTFKKTILIKNKDCHWVRPDLALNPSEEQEYFVRIRYRQELQKATLYRIEDDVYIDFENPQSSVAEGQFAAWYLDNELIGSGVI